MNQAADQAQDDDAAARDTRAAEILPASTASADLQAAIDRLGAQGVFRPYQREMIRLSHVHELLVVEKSRRVGATWAFAGDDVVTATSLREFGGDDVLYISYSHDMAREYIDACAAFAKALMGVDAAVGETMFEDEDPRAPGETRQIKAFRIDFASGFCIQALSSRPRSLRGKQGKVRIDEAAFVDDLAELIKAAMALVMLGGSVVVLSTHNGVGSEFNKLIEEIRGGEREGHVFRVTFREAVDDGLYETQALRKGELPTEEGKAAYVAKIRKLYGSAAAEELDVIPSRGSGSWLAFDHIERAEDPTIPVVTLQLEDHFSLQPDHLRLAWISDWCEAELLPLLAPIGAADLVGVGGDFGRQIDLSVMWPTVEQEDRSLRTLFVLELRNVPFTEQESIWAYVLSRLRRWKAALDAQGNGAYLAERMVQRFGQARVVAITSTQANWRRENFPPVKSRFESEGRIFIPRHKGIAADLRGVVVVDGVPSIPATRKNVKGEEAAAGKAGGKRHCDTAVALVNSVFAHRSGIAGPIEFQSAAPTGVTNPAWGDSLELGDAGRGLRLRGY